MEYEIGDDEPVSTAVLHAVSAVVGQEPCSLDPLAHVVDTDALDALFQPRRDGHPRPGGRLTFVYSNCRVSVDNGEFLSIEPLDHLRGTAPPGGPPGPGSY